MDQSWTCCAAATADKKSRRCAVSGGEYRDEYKVHLGRDRGNRSQAGRERRVSLSAQYGHKPVKSWSGAGGHLSRPVIGSEVREADFRLIQPAKKR